MLGHEERGTMKRKLKRAVIGAASLLIALCIVAVNSYLSNKHLFLYATGTKDKAFLNATWKMSPQEIERANKTVLSTSDLPILITPEVVDQSRFKTMIQKDLLLWGHASQVHYEFFDNMPYEYRATLTAYDLEKPHKEILETLRTQFGKEKEVQKKRTDIVYSFEWATAKQDISYWMGHNEDGKSYYVFVKARYKPFYEHIEAIARSEKKSYF